MPRRFFRRFALKREQFHGRWYLAPFSHLLHDPRLWGVRRRNVVPAFSLGLFMAFMPLPGQFLASALLALALRIHIPVAVLSTLASNPLTIGPIYYFSYRLGLRLMDAAPQPFQFELSFGWFTGRFLEIWQPLLLGSVILGTVAALFGYVVLDLLWRASLADYIAARRRRRRQTTDNKNQ
ncbi:MAG: DUF2062 domain-containing protein [Woeseia sp.]